MLYIFDSIPVVQPTVLWNVNENRQTLVLHNIIFFCFNTLCQNWGKSTVHKSFRQLQDIFLLTLLTSRSQHVMYPVNGNKSTATIKCSEFGPINVLPIHEKLLECTVHKQIMSYINTYNILIETHSGFRENHSSETSLRLVLST